MPMSQRPLPPVVICIAAKYVELLSIKLKASEVVHRSARDFPYADMHDHVRWLIDTFGRERVIWGSDFPNVSDAAR